MSRIGKKAVAIPAGVTVTLDGQTVTVKGAKGQLSWTVVDEIEVSSDVDVEADATSYDHSAAVTRAIMAAVNDPTSSGRRAQDPLALAAVYLTFWEGLTRPQVARELEVLPKTANAAVGRVLDQVKGADLL